MDLVCERNGRPSLGQNLMGNSMDDEDWKKKMLEVYKEC